VRVIGTLEPPKDDVGGVVPVGGFVYVGLLAPDLRRCGGKVAVPVVEAHAHPAEELQERVPAA